MDDNNSPNSESEEPTVPETPLPNIEAFTDVPKITSRRNLYIGVGLAIVLALAVSSFLIVRNSPKKPASSGGIQPASMQASPPSKT